MVLTKHAPCLVHDAGKSWNLLGIDLIYAVEFRAVDWTVGVQGREQRGYLDVRATCTTHRGTLPDKSPGRLEDSLGSASTHRVEIVGEITAAAPQHLEK